MKQNRNAPIGVFDSGVGGLSVLNDIRRLLPKERLIYVGDSAYAPYGNRYSQEVVDRSSKITEFFTEQRAKAVVIACNTATAEAANHLRRRFSVPIIGMEPAVKPAAERSKSGVIGVLATQRTIKSERLQGLTQRFAQDKKVLAVACPGLVECVENGHMESIETEALLRQYIEPLLEQHVDALILGCTHYPFLIPAIRKITGQEVDILQTGMPVARQLQRVLEQNDLLSYGQQQLKSEHLILYNTSQQRRHHTIMKSLWYKQTSDELEVNFLEL